MDMKRILQALDSTSTKPVEGANDMKKFLSVVAEGKNPKTNRMSTAEQMVVQEYVQPKKTITNPVLNVAKDAKPSMIGKYFKQIEEEFSESNLRHRARASQLAERVTAKINELSTDTLASYKKKAGADAKKADAEGDYKRGDKRFKGINKATNKQFDNDLKKHGQHVSEAEGEPEGVAHLTKELLTHIVQQSGKEGAHAVIKSLEWGDGAAKELLHLIINDLKDDIKGMSEDWSQKYKKSINCSHPKGFSQKAHCAGKKKHNESVEMESVCPDCGMCATHGNSMLEVKQRLDAKCWKGKHKEGTKIKGGVRVNNCVPNEDIEEDLKDPKDNPCWTGYKPVGTKKKGGKTVPNCVPK